MRNIIAENMGTCEEVTRARIKASTEALLASLRDHHDYSIKRPVIELLEFIKPVVEPEPINPLETWTERQRKIHPPIKSSWFRIVDDLGEIGTTGPAIEEIQKAVCEHYGVTRAEIVSSRRAHRMILPRHVTMYLIKTMTRKSAKEIGRRIGDRNHASILFGINKVKRLLTQDAAIAHDVETIRAIIVGGAIA